MKPSMGPIRPPSEAYSMLVRATKNCPWNRCTFCTVAKGQKFEIRPVETVKADILSHKKMVEDIYEYAERSGHRIGEIARYNDIPWLLDDGVNSVFIQDSDSLIMKTEQLVEILEFLRQTFPTIERVCTYARGKTIFNKTLDELKQLRAAGLSRIHMGLETGDDELLAEIRKGATAGEMIQAGRKAIAAGLEVSAYIMPGLGGQERWEQHAANSADVLNAINPRFIRLRTFHLPGGTPIYEKAERGAFHIQSIEGVILEVRRFIEALEVTSELITTDYAHNYYLGYVDAKLPEEKERLIGDLDNALADWRSRGEPKRNPFWGGLNRHL
ncbi:MAG: radical SAM protein [Desulfobacterales bacterium]